MTILLVLGTFLVFILIDLFLNRKQQARPIDVEAPHTQASLLSIAIIDGIPVPGQLRYHPGHAWLTEERPAHARVGVDAFAARHFSNLDSIEAPSPGRWVRQGQKAFTLISGGERLELVSPAEGEVTEINAEVLRNPTLLLTDPYGQGWLAKINMPDPDLVLRNLLPKPLIHAWMREEIRERRALRPMASAKAVNGR